VDSRDFRRHLDWLLDQLDGRTESLLALQESGWTAYASVYWLSRSGTVGR
jgi:hypothetical protein